MVQSSLVTAVVLNWNNYENTSATLAGLQAVDHRPLDIILVDNGSSDSSGERLAREFDSVRTEFLDENLGFPGGNNVGIRLALDEGAEYIWLVNNDLLFPQPEVLGSLLGHLRRDEQLGLVSPLITHYPETDEIWFRQGYIDHRSGKAGHEINRKPYLMAGRNRPPSRADGLLANLYVPFCAVLIRASLFEEIGLLDEAYFLYGSDIDFCLRASRKGYVLATDDDSVVNHKVSASSNSTQSSIVSYYSARNRWLTRRKHDVAGSHVFYPLYAWQMVLRLGYLLMVGEFQSYRALLQGCYDGFRGIDGRGPYPD